MAKKEISAKSATENKNAVVENNAAEQPKVFDLVEQTAKSGKAVGVNPELSDEAKALHVECCKRIMAWHGKNADIAKYQALQALRAQGAGKNDVYAKGYKSVNETKATQVAKMYRRIKKMNIGGGSDDVIFRLALKFYDAYFKAHKNEKTGKCDIIKMNSAFESALKKAEQLGKWEGHGHGDFKRMCANLGIALDKAATEAATAETEAA